MTASRDPTAHLAAADENLRVAFVLLAARAVCRYVIYAPSARTDTAQG